MFRHIEAYQSALSEAVVWMSCVMKMGLLMKGMEEDIEADQLISSYLKSGDGAEQLVSSMLQGDKADLPTKVAVLVTKVARCWFLDLVKNLEKEVVTVDNQGQIYRVTKIQPKDPGFPIIGELRIYIMASNFRVKLGVHGLWMGYVDEFGVVHLINSKPTADDEEWAHKELERLLSDPAKRARMETMWRSFKGKKSKSKVRIHECTKHSRTNSSELRPMYFQNTLHLASQFMGGPKGLRNFLGKYKVGIPYDRREFALDMKKQFGASVRIVCSNPEDPNFTHPCLSELGFVFDGNWRLLDFPDQNILEGKIIVRPQ